MDYRQYLKELTSRPIPKEAAFPESEYRRRAAAVRGFMAEADLDALLVTFVPNVCYMTGYHAFAADLFACMVLPAVGEPTLQVTEFEIPGALLTGSFYSPVTLRHPGTLGIGFSETLAVTETGCEILTKHDRTLTVVPAA
jgi:Xaa-Pro aminopeptidase